jgi:formate dehydrogenase subunit gamma
MDSDSSNTATSLHLIPRFNAGERVAHWLLAGAFAVMLASGAFMGGFGPLDHHVLLITHVGAAVALVGGLAALVTSRRTRRPLAQTADDLRRLTPGDWRWLRAAPRAYVTGGELPPAGRFNGGQKINARSLLLVLTLLYVSGLGELGRSTRVLEPLRTLGALHGFAAGIAGILVAAHVYLGLVHPATRPALRGIIRGSVRREWAEHHHAIWVASEDRKRRLDSLEETDRERARSQT